MTDLFFDKDISLFRWPRENHEALDNIAGWKTHWGWGAAVGETGGYGDIDGPAA